MLCLALSRYFYCLSWLALVAGEFAVCACDIIVKWDSCMMKVFPFEAVFVMRVSCATMFLLSAERSRYANCLPACLILVAIAMP